MKTTNKRLVKKQATAEHLEYQAQKKKGDELKLTEFERTARRMKRGDAFICAGGALQMTLIKEATKTNPMRGWVLSVADDITDSAESSEDIVETATDKKHRSSSIGK